MVSHDPPRVRVMSQEWVIDWGRSMPLSWFNDASCFLILMTSSSLLGCNIQFSILIFFWIVWLFCMVCFPWWLYTADDYCFSSVLLPDGVLQYKQWTFVLGNLTVMNFHSAGSNLQNYIIKGATIRYPGRGYDFHVIKRYLFHIYKQH